MAIVVDAELLMAAITLMSLTVGAVRDDSRMLAVPIKNGCHAFSSCWSGIATVMQLLLCQNVSAHHRKEELAYEVIKKLKKNIITISYIDSVYFKS